MILSRERTRDPIDGVPREPGGPSPDPIGAWLDVLGALLRLPPADRAEIREELESHLRDRARDLMLAGATESDAASRAIAELGSAAQLADRYLAVRTRPLMRRHAMQLAVLGLAGAATVLSVVAVTNPPAGPAPAANGGQAIQPASPDEAVRQAVADMLVRRAKDRVALATQADVLRLVRQAYAERQDQPLSGITLRAQFDGTPLNEVLTFIAESSGLPYIIRWATIEGADMNDVGRRQRSTPVTLNLKAEVPLDRLLALVNQAVDVSPVPDPIEYRLADGILEIAARGYFDRSERTLVAYDLSALGAKGVDLEQVVGLITSLVEADNWRDNGGDIADAHVLADRLFITAPPRMHERIRWVVGQLEPANEEHAEEHAAAEINDSWGTPILADIPLLGHTIRSRTAK